MTHASRAVLIAATLCLPALALAEDKPAFSIDNKATEASVTIDDALKSYPGLYDKLLAEGRREALKWSALAEADRKKEPSRFKDGGRYSFVRSYTQRSVAGRYVSIVRNDGADGGGAHPNENTNTILWDTEAKKNISVRPFFTETADNGATLNALAKAIRAALAAEKKARDVPVGNPDTDTELASVKPKLLEIGALALAPSTDSGKSSGLICYFSPYAVGSYVEGSYTVFVPWTEFKTRLSPEGAAVFGGERPKSDADND
jgi:hypothetical protein